MNLSHEVASVIGTIRALKIWLNLHLLTLLSAASVECTVIQSTTKLVDK